ncbi:hypothetical protein [Embleya sp. AB8]|uniref:hypothetical protein n=1 Tax=Embleya sp. AB8 TaxID=3156304 RepID=UPI003C76D61B
MSEIPTSDASTADPTAGTRPTRRRRTTILALSGIVTAALVAGALTLGGAFDGDAPKATAAAAEQPAAPTPEPPATVTRITHADVKALTDARTKAVKNGDATAFVSGIDPANAELMAGQQTLLANLRLFPFARAEFRPPATLDVVQAADAGPYSYDFVIAFVHQLDGVDSAEAVETYTWTMERASIEAPLRITKIVGGATTGTLDSVKYPAPWDGDELAVLQREHVLLAVEVEDRSRAEAWADQAETAAKRNAEAWHGPAITPRRFMVFVPTTGATIKPLLGKGNVTGACELVAPARPDGRNMPPIGSRVTFDGTGSVLGYGDANARIGLMRGPLAQAMVGQFAHSSQAGAAARSRWVSEGFAQYLAGDGRTPAVNYEASARAQLRAGRFTGKLPVDDDLLTFGKNDQAAGASYHLSFLTIRYLAEKYGVAKVDEFVVAMYSRPVLLDDAIRAATGLDRARFEAEWAEYVRAELGG